MQKIVGLGYRLHKYDLRSQTEPLKLNWQTFFSMGYEKSNKRLYGTITRFEHITSIYLQFWGQMVHQH